MLWSGPRGSSPGSGVAGAASGPSGRDGDIAFLFRNGALADATAEGERLTGGAQSLAELVSVLRRRFPGISALETDASGDAAGGGDDRRRVPSVLPEDDAYLTLDRRGETLAITLHDATPRASERHLMLSQGRTSDLIAGMIDNAPVAIWALDSDGRIAHANAAFARLAELSGRDMPFDVAAEDIAFAKRRVWLEYEEDGGRHWYDLSTQVLPDGTRVFFAANADAIVTAEIAQRNFVQTLTKTFAQLSIGLAIFDRHRQLALFNPALIDLTSLPADFLSARPTLAAFFDQLRDRQIMPEPRNYRNWRDQLSDMITAARDGAYCETWTLPNGLTYRISGKPHPDGAVAFLFEDISAEITLTRRFRAELEQSQAVIDAIDCAIAVFSRSGVLTFANEAFRRLWDCRPDESFIELTVVDVSKIWQERCAPTPVWGDLRDFVRSVEERTDWQDSVFHRTHGPLSVMAAPVSGGATLVRFVADAPGSLLDLPSGGADIGADDGAAMPDASVGPAPGGTSEGNPEAAPVPPRG